MKRKIHELREEDRKVLLTFLKLTKEGKYAKIDESSLRYTRIKEQREDPCYDYDKEEYYYSIR